ncbi:iron-containing alcohol dehydrogenase [Peribacillus loiseleuriae]|uniref:iron-containing alcohol dehydrogenase n=1 Tax=Peribacillus loiseleuriae TaxID=1679170 RepID=UPI0006714BCF|nr:iron-containing alcohol dehydrogenase [Peribacillus loiseleuriae]
MNFSFYSPARIHFGCGVRKEIGERSKFLGEKCLIVRTPVKNNDREKYFQDVIASLTDNGIQYVIFDGVKPNPTIDIVDHGKMVAINERVDFILAYGGGSAMDTAKAIALMAFNNDFTWESSFREFSDPFHDHDQSVKALPIVTITTTSGTGSQVTQAAVVTDTERKEKLTLFHSCLFPRVSIVDPELMITVPEKSTATTGFDAMCHAIESYFNPRATKLTETLSLQAISIIVEALPLVMKDLENVSLREKLAYADTLAGICLSNAGAEAPHPIAETINGYFPDLAHGETLSFVYPNYLKHVSTIIPEKVETLLSILKDYNPSTKQSTLAEKASLTMVNFLQMIGLSERFPYQEDKEALIREMKAKLFFNLPLTNSKLMQEILEESL